MIKADNIRQDMTLEMTDSMGNLERGQRVRVRHCAWFTSRGAYSLTLEYSGDTNATEDFWLDRDDEIPAIQV